MNKEPLRMLYITDDEFPPFRPDVEILFGKEMLDRGYKIDWIMRSADPDTTTSLVQWHNCNVWVAATNAGRSRIDRVRKHLSTLKNEAKMFDLVKTGNYEAIQVKDKFLAAVMASIAARKQKIKFFYWLSFPFPEASLAAAKRSDSRYRVFYFLRGTLFTFLLYKYICRRADHIFVQSEEMKRVMAQKGVLAEKMTAVPMGVSSAILDAVHSKPSENPPETSQLGSSQIVLYLGSLDRARQLEFIIESFSMIAQSHPQAVLYFVGDSEESGARSFLESEAKRLNVEQRVIFTGFLPREEALRYVHAAQVCVSLTRSDSVYGVASLTKLVEYLALRKPVLANTHPDQKQVLEESGGGLCVPWELQPFADAMAWLLDHPQEAKAMSEKGRIYVQKNRTYTIIADKLDAQYQHLMANIKS